MQEILVLALTNAESKVDSHSPQLNKVDNILELKELRIIQIEIETKANISDITIEIYNERKTIVIPFWNKWKQLFIHQDFYILDTSEVESLRLDTTNLNFSFKVVSSQNFKAKIYCLTNRRQKVSSTIEYL